MFPRENACIEGGGEASSHRREPVQCRLKRILGEKATHRSAAGFTTQRTFISRAGGKIKRKVARNFRKSRSLPWHECISALITAIYKNFDDNRNSNTIYIFLGFVQIGIFALIQAFILGKIKIHDKFLSYIVINDR